MSKLYEMRELLNSINEKIKLPRYSEKTGKWIGGDKMVVYAFVDKRTNKAKISPIQYSRGIGPEVNVRVATAEEANREGFKTSKGWKVEG